MDVHPRPLFVRTAAVNCNSGPFELYSAPLMKVIASLPPRGPKQDIMRLWKFRACAAGRRFRDSEWDLKFHVQVAQATQNSALATIVEKMWSQRLHNPYWRKLHEHIDEKSIESWCEDHDLILKALIRRDPHAAKLAMWQHLENTKQMLFRATSVISSLM